MYRIPSLGILLALAACTVGPDYVTPKPPVASAPAFIGSASPAVTSADQPAGNWWQLYQDPILDGLVADTLAANKDIAIAAANLDKARAALRGVRGDRLPSATFDARGGYQRLPSIQSLPGFSRNNGVVDGGISIAYEVDLFGRISRGIEAARGDVAAADADRDAVRVAIVAETTRAYADLGSLAERIRVARRIVVLVDQSVKLTAKRYEAGRATRLNTARAATLRDQVRASVPPLEAERDAALYSLALLTGRTPRDLPPTIHTGATLLHLDRPLPVGDGRALLARRPDVRAAERRLAAQTARIGVATADLYPTISLGASVGSTSTGFGNSLTSSALRFFTGGLLSWNFLNQEAARANIDGANADTAAALAGFDQTILQALRETETALSAFTHELDRRQALGDASAEAAIAVRIVRAQLREGRVDSLSLIDAERSFADTEAALAASNARVITAQIDLFRALGGGWQADATAPAGTAAAM
ncbi:outer membrane efflux protein [Polymorphobacter glacialis]|uniref:Outer membrane efflux protein n=1 Tax=Sandarakinorhabdus glacialis TaxID=1614636 RepID=A0A917E4W6_9SPHN|nr:TolC family protein [Polymorphobacter glacialis]GGE03275.1 outer membrane efflux protein [Polymorphobacter glacialis]